VEPWTEIVKNSKQVPCLMDPSAKKHMKTWRAMNRIGGKSNSGEGGEDPKRFQKT
jgi:glutamate synthase (ferredoxin)